MGWGTRDSLVGWLRGRLAAHHSAEEDAWGGGGRAHERVPGVARCDVCGRTILAGEEISRFRRDERLVAVCSLCEARILAQGFVRAA
jgi:hypothetical protein